MGRMTGLRRPSLKGLYAFLLITSVLAIQYLPDRWLPEWLVPVVFLEMAFVSGAFLLELRRDRRDAESRREAALRAREADPLRYGQQPDRAHPESDRSVP